MKLITFLMPIVLSGCAAPLMWMDSNNQPATESTLNSAKTACDYEKKDAKAKNAVSGAFGVARYESNGDKSKSTAMFNEGRDIRRELNACMESKGFKPESKSK